MAEPDPGGPPSLAWIRVGLGDIDDAFAWVTDAVNHNDDWIHALKSCPFLDPIRVDPRFAVLLLKLSLEL